MATLGNRDWYIADASGQPIKVRCLSQNYVLGTARVVDELGRFGEIGATALMRTPEEILALDLADETLGCKGTRRLTCCNDWVPCPGCRDCATPADTEDKHDG